MPNHITNIVRITGEGAEEVFKKIKGKKDIDGSPTHIDFNKIVPMPEELRDTTSGSDEYRTQAIIKLLATKCGENPKKMIKYIKENVDFLLDIPEGELARLKLYLQYGCTSWYDWACKYWGTKWNAYHQERNEDEIYFETAWATPEPVIAALSRKFPKVTIEVQYADEDIGSNCGKYTYKAGVLLEMWNPEGKEAEEFALQIKGYDPDEWYDEQNQ